MHHTKVPLGTTLADLLIVHVTGITRLLPDLVRKNQPHFLKRSLISSRNSSQETVSSFPSS